MATIKIYHNPDFLNYHGDHSQIIPPIHPVATVNTPDNFPSDALLDLGFTQTQHVGGSWYDNPDVLVHLRSTSVGDVISMPDGTLYVVESCGFKPYQPKTIRPAQKLAEACRLLEIAVDEGSTYHLRTLTRQALAAVQHALAAEGYPECDAPILWEKAQVGDLVGDPEVGQFRVIARKLNRKWRAKQLVEHIPQAQVWIDGPRSWAVLVPAASTEEVLI
jgi:hypothetical protein